MQPAVEARAREAREGELREDEPARGKPHAPREPRVPEHGKQPAARPEREEEAQRDARARQRDEEAGARREARARARREKENERRERERREVSPAAFGRAGEERVGGRKDEVDEVRRPDRPRERLCSRHARRAGRRTRRIRRTESRRPPRGPRRERVLPGGARLPRTPARRRGPARRLASRARRGRGQRRRRRRAPARRPETRERRRRRSPPASRLAPRAVPTGTARAGKRPFRSCCTRAPGRGNAPPPAYTPAPRRAPARDVPSPDSQAAIPDDGDREVEGDSEKRAPRRPAGGTAGLPGRRLRSEAARARARRTPKADSRAAPPRATARPYRPSSARRSRRDRHEPARPPRGRSGREEGSRTRAPGRRPGAPSVPSSRGLAPPRF